MNNLRVPAILVLLATIAIAVPASAAPQPKPPKVPARIEVSVDPEAVSPGGTARVTVQLAPGSGIRINRYPKMKLSVEPVEGVVGGAEVAVGNDGPPPADDMESNYYDDVDPLALDLEIDADAPGGNREIDGRLTYFYCVKASGFCAPKRTQVKIPINVLR